VPEDRIPIGHITNGVHIASWLAMPMTLLLGRHLEHDGREETYGPRAWMAIDQIDETEFWEQHEILRANLVEFVRRRACRQAESRSEEPLTRPDGRPCLDPSVLTVGFARRFAAYKRADLLFRDLDRLDHLVNHPEQPVQFIYAGKAHPNDEQGKRLLQQVFHVSRDPRFVGRVVFIENHDINVGRHLAQGVDLWLNTPRRPNEACGTSGQKVVLNGGLNLSTLDGWWAQAYDGANGFAIGEGGEHADPDRQDQLDLEALYRVLETEVVPLFYDRDADGVPHEWVASQRRAIRTLAGRFSARRMVMDYTLNCYLPAVGAPTSSLPPSATR
jgi:starch phosphorylase